MTMSSSASSYATRVASIDGLAPLQGQELGVTPWKTLTQEMIQAFAHLTDDDQWIHTDPDRCASDSPFGAPIAHGFLVLSLASSFCRQAFSVDEVGMAINYGLDRVRFIHPTPAGAQLRGRVVLLSYTPHPPGARLKLRVTFELEAQDKPAAVAEFILLFFPPLP